MNQKEIIFEMLQIAYNNRTIETDIPLEDIPVLDAEKTLYISESNEFECVFAQAECGFITYLIEQGILESRVCPRTQEQKLDCNRRQANDNKYKSLVPSAIEKNFNIREKKPLDHTETTIVKSYSQS